MATFRMVRGKHSRPRTRTSRTTYGSTAAATKSSECRAVWADAPAPRKSRHKRTFRQSGTTGDQAFETSLCLAAPRSETGSVSCRRP